MPTFASNLPLSQGATSMSYFDAVSAGFRNFFDFQGRATRPEFWWFMLFLFLLGLGTAVADMSFGLSHDGMGPINLFASIATLIPMLSVGARRLHDIGRTGWWQLLYFVPIIGWLVLIIFWCTRTQPA